MTKTKAQPKRGRGRPSLGDSSQIMIRLPDALARRLDAYRRTAESLPSRSNAIRDILDSRLPK